MSIVKSSKGKDKLLLEGYSYRRAKKPSGAVQRTTVLVVFLMMVVNTTK